MRGVAVVLAVLALLILPAGAAAITDGTTTLVDRPAGFGSLPFDGIAASGTQRHAISADGCFIVFESQNDALFTGDQDAGRNIFRKDRCSPGHPLIQVNVSATGEQPAPGVEADDATISADGRYVAFRSREKNLHPAADGSPQIFVKDLQTGTVFLASRGNGTDGAVAASVQSGVISGDGMAVVFDASGVLDGGVQNGHDIDGLAGQVNAYVRYLDGAQTFLVSAKEDGTPVGGVGNDFDLSANGAAVAYVTQEPVVAADMGDEDDDAYVARNIGGALTQTFVTYNVGNTAGATTADDVAISSDGNQIAFVNTHPWFETCNPTCDAGKNLDFNVDPALTADQRFGPISFAHTAGAPTRVIWTTNAPLLGGDTNGYDDLYSHSLADLNVSGLSRLTPGTHPAFGDSNGQATDDGAVVVYGSSSPVLAGSNGATDQLFAQAGGDTTNLSQPEGEPLHTPDVLDSFVDNLHALSADGRFVAFRTQSPGLGVPLIADKGFIQQVFLRDVLTGDLVPVSVSNDGTFANEESYAPSISADGTRVAFLSQATNLAPNVPSRLQHAYIRDLTTHTTKLLDRGTGGMPAAGGSGHAQLSADGRTVVFSSDSPDLPGANGTDDHVFAADADGGSVTPVDTNAGGLLANADSTDPDISADGNRIEFTSAADNLGGAATGTGTHVYVKDRTTGAVLWASPPENQATGRSSAFDASLSADGQRVAYVNTDPLFGYGAENKAHIFLRDLAAGTTELVSVGAPPGTSEREPSLSADGRRLTFVADLSGSPSKAYLRDLTAGTTTILENGQFNTFDASLSSSGTCAAFGSRSSEIVSPGYGFDFPHVYLRAIGGDCPPVPPGGGPGGPTPDTTAPVISGLRVTNKRFRLGTGRTAVSAKQKRAKRGTTFVFTLSERARTTIAIAQRKAGRKKGKRCVKPRKGLKKRCTRYVAKITLTRTRTAQGANRVKFSGRTSKGRLKPGRYRATLRATDAAGNRSKPRTVSFTIVRR